MVCADFNLSFSFSTASLFSTALKPPILLLFLIFVSSSLKAFVSSCALLAHRSRLLAVADGRSSLFSRSERTWRSISISSSKSRISPGASLTSSHSFLIWMIPLQIWTPTEATCMPPTRTATDAMILLRQRNLRPFGVENGILDDR